MLSFIFSNIWCFIESSFDFCETESIGKSFEGRDMIVLKVFMFLFLKVDGNENRKGSRVIPSLGYPLVLRSWAKFFCPCCNKPPSCFQNKSSYGLKSQRGRM